jgi:hypothetical protein
MPEELVIFSIPVIRQVEEREKASSLLKKEVAID